MTGGRAAEEVVFTYNTTGAAEKELKKAGFTQNPRLPDIWYSEKYYAKVKEIVP